LGHELRGVGQMKCNVDGSEILSRNYQIQKVLESQRRDRMNCPKPTAEPMKRIMHVANR